MASGRDLGASERSTLRGRRAPARHRGGLWARRRGMQEPRSVHDRLARGQLRRRGWRSTPSNPFRLTTVGTWNPYGKEGSRRVGGPYHPLANFCSAHYFDVDGSTVAYAWYGEGTRFLDISDPANLTQFAYWRPDDGIVWASYMHKGYVYTADRTRGVDVLRLTPSASAARRAGREVVAPSPSASQRRSRRGWPSATSRIPAPPGSACSGPVGRHQAQALAPTPRVAIRLAPFELLELLSGSCTACSSLALTLAVGPRARGSAFR